MKKFFSLIITILFTLSLFSCSNVNNNKEYEIYRLATTQGFTGTYEEWIESIKGTPGKDGREIELNIVDNKIVWHYVGEETWTYIYSVNDLIGPKGDTGENGSNGLSTYEIYLKYHPEYNKSEEEWLDDLVNGRLSSDDRNKTFKVEFKTFTATELPTQNIKYGNKLVEPSIPVRDGYICDGWYLDDLLWDFNEFFVTKNMILEAHWSKSQQKQINLVYSGAISTKDFNLGLFEKFKEYRKALGDNNIYKIDYLEIGPDKIDSEVKNWEEGPDVYEFSSDKITALYQKGALARLTTEQSEWVENNNNKAGFNFAQFNGSTYGYPFTGDNTYYFQYDKSLIDERDVHKVEDILKVCENKGLKFGYMLEEGFWGAGAMFTFGADYKMEFNPEGMLKKITSDFNGLAGQKAIKGIEKIITNKSWTNQMAIPTPDNKFVGCIAGTWEIPAYKAQLGENYGCAPMPTITVDGETKHLGAFLGGKVLGVNPNSSRADNDRIKAAHDLAKFLSDEESQLARFESLNIAPCNIKAAANKAVLNDINIKCLIEQADFAHVQTSVPQNLWVAPTILVRTLKESHVPILDYATLAKQFNDSILESR